MQPAELLYRNRDQGINLFQFGDVGHLEVRVGAERGRQILTSVALDVGDDHSRALGHKLLHDAPPDTRSTAGNDGHLAD
jgi:hypothetical protein